jgi:hypothetical protein
MLTLRYDSNDNYSYGCSQREPFCSRLVGPHTIFRKPLCRCDFQLCLTHPSFTLGSYPLQLIVFGILTGATIDPISKHMICVELGFFLPSLCSCSPTTKTTVITTARSLLKIVLSPPDRFDGLAISGIPFLDSLLTTYPVFALVSLFSSIHCL